MGDSRSVGYQHLPLHFYRFPPYDVFNCVPSVHLVEPPKVYRSFLLCPPVRRLFHFPHSQSQHAFDFFPVGSQLTPASWDTIREVRPYLFLSAPPLRKGGPFTIPLTLIPPFFVLPLTDSRSRGRPQDCGVFGWVSTRFFLFF